MASSKHISQDEIQYIVDVESSKAQQEIHKLEKASASLRAENKARLKQLIEWESQGKKESKGYKDLQTIYKETAKKISELTGKIGDMTSKLDVNQMTMKQLKKQARDLRRNLEDTSKAANPEEYAKLEQQLSAVTCRMSELKQDAKSFGELLSSDGTQSVLMGNLLTRLADKLGETSRRIKDYIAEVAEEGVEMAREADGITRAFKNLNNDNLLDDLRKATKGTVNDIELMKAAVQANDFRIPVENLGKYLQFAQLKAQQTGQSVDYLTNSIITGLGRKSPQILDNLGISQSELKERMKETGDMASAVSAIVEEQLKKAGNAYVSASDRSAQAAVKIQNAQRALGEELLPLSEQYEETYTDIQLRIINVVKWVVKHREVVVALALAMAGLTVATLKQTGTLAGNIVATKGLAAAHAVWNQVATTGKGLLILLQSGFYLLTGRITKAKTAWAAMNATMKTNLIYLATTAVVALCAALYTWKQRNNEVSQSQRNLDSIQADAAKKSVDQKRKIESLVKAMNNENLSMKQREAAAKKLNKIIPGYNAHLDKTRRRYVANKQKLDEYIKSLVRMYEVMGAKEKIKQLGEEKAQIAVERAQAEKELEEARKKYNKQRNANQGIVPGAYSGATQMGEVINLQQYQNALGAKDRALALKDKQIKAITDIYGSEIQQSDIQEPDLDYGDDGGGVGGGNYGGGNIGGGNAPDPDELLVKQYDEAREKSLKEWQTFYEQRQLQLKEALAKQQITQEEYNTQSGYLENINAETILAIEQSYYDESAGLTFKDENKKKELQKKYNDYVDAAKKKSNEQKIALEESYYQALGKITEAGQQGQELTLEQERQAELSVLDAYYKTALERARLYGEDEKAVTEAYEKAKANIVAKYEKKIEDEKRQARQEFGLGEDEESRMAAERQKRKEAFDSGKLTQEEYDKSIEQLESEHQQRLLQVRQQYGLATNQELFDAELEQLKQHLDNKELTEEEYEDAVKNLKFQHWKEEFDYYSQLFGGAVSALQDAEMANVDAKYDAEIEAARQAGQDTTDLENKKANEKLKIQKKYADVNFAIKASEIIANTAGAIMTALDELGPIAGPIAAALMGVTGAAQLAAANAERQKVKRMTLNGSSSSSSSSGARVATGLESGGSVDVEREQDGKKFHASYDPDKRGYIDRPTVIVGEGPTGRSKEWVASNAALNNPTVAPLIDIIDRAQRVGQISTLDMRKYLMQRQLRGAERGGSITTSSVPQTTVQTMSMDTLLMQRLSTVLERIDKRGIPAYVALDEFDAEQKRREQSRRIGSKV